MKHLLTAALIASAFALPASGEEEDLVTIQQFYNMCAAINTDVSAVSDFNFGMCIGIVKAIDQIGLMNCNSNKNFGHEIPTYLTANTDQVSYGALLQAMTNWAAENPELWDHGVAYLILAAAETFPCDLD